MRIGVVHIRGYRFIERLASWHKLIRIHQHRAHVVVVAARIRRIQFHGLVQLRLHFRELVQSGQRQCIVVVVAGIRWLQFNRFLVGFRSFVQRRVFLGSGLGLGQFRIRLRQIAPDYILLRIHFRRFAKRRQGDVELLALQRFHALVEGVVQVLVLLHRTGAFLDLLFQRSLLFRRHIPSLLRRQLAGFHSLRLRLAPCLLALQVEVHRQRIAQPGPHIVNRIPFLAIHHQRDLVGSKRQAGVEIVALLLRLYLVMTFDVFAVDVDYGVFQRLTVFAFHVALKGRCLRQRTARKRE